MYSSILNFAITTMLRCYKYLFIIGLLAVLCIILYTSKFNFYKQNGLIYLPLYQRGSDNDSHVYMEESIHLDAHDENKSKIAAKRYQANIVMKGLLCMLIVTFLLTFQTFLPLFATFSTVTQCLNQCWRWLLGLPTRTQVEHYFPFPLKIRFTCLIWLLFQG